MWSIYIFFFLGVVAAISHHAFYMSLDGTEAKQQLVMLRYGGVLSYVSKASFMASIVLSFRQQIWATFRRNLLSIDAIDSLFAVMEDPTAMLNLEVFKNAKVAMFLAIAVWLSPLLVILTPGTLTVEPRTLVNITSCSSVTTLNFTPEATWEWRNPPRIHDVIELSIAWYNTTSRNVEDPDFFDYFSAASQQVELSSRISAYLQKPVPRRNVALDICGSGWNCSYSIAFKGPGYKCSDQDIVNSPFTTSLLLPEGNASYIAHATVGDYAKPQIDCGEGGIPLQTPPYPERLGVFRTDPVLWIGYSSLKEGKTKPANLSEVIKADVFQSKIFSCRHYETNYEVSFNYSSQTQDTTVTKREFLKPIIDTTFIPGQDANDGTRDNTTAAPEANYIYPKDMEKYKLTAAYYSLGAQLRNHINGTMQFDDETGTITKTEATNTKLFNLETYLPVENLMSQLQSFYEDMILSLLSNPHFLVVAWAAGPANLSGEPKGGPMYECTKTRERNVFDYRARDLWLVYGTFILISFVSVVLGRMARSQNSGTFRNDRFSSIVGATRGPHLDHLDWRVDSKGDMPPEVGKAKIGYGLVISNTGVDHNLGEIFFKSE
ncbi:hypothetical protein BJ875DRAFT_384657 [Amylocarpus encephaloides]|uniref:Uncharacterized protein n=1 Tax=Amylocarpus encephaloides TaxID=45428 RepID=A0A9P7YCG2_9HELO|nr:hypothetical protein BJ875DRAFT_384657 [Amylocarpus encephaloides]